MSPKQAKGVLTRDVNEKKVRWTLREKRTLLESIQNHGLADLKKLQFDVKTRTVAEIQLFLQNRRRILYQNYNCQKLEKNQASSLSANQSIIGWCNTIRDAVDFKHRGKDYSKVLEEIFESAAEEESEVIPSEGEPNFSLLYMYLSRALSGSLPPSLPPLESWTMLLAWRSLTDTIKKVDWPQEKHFLTNLHLREKVPLDPEFKKLSAAGLWQALKEFQQNSSTSNSITNPETEIAGPSKNEFAGPSEIEIAGPSDTEIAERSKSEIAGPSGSEIAGPSGSEIAGPSGSEIAGPSGEQRKYNIFDISEHAHALVLASLNPLTVPVDMLQKETDIVFPK